MVGAKALEKAAVDEKMKDVQKLLAQKIPPDAPAAYGADTPMYYAARSGNVEMIRALKEAGADVNLASPGCKWLPLQMAVTNGCQGAIETLLELGADPLATTDNGQGIIEYARASGVDGTEDFVVNLLAKHFEAPTPGVALTEKITTMPKLRLKNAGPAA